MPNPLDRLRELWAKKPWTKPVGLSSTLDQCDFVYVAPPSPMRPLGMRMSDPTDASILFSLAETRLMDLLPEDWIVMHHGGKSKSWEVLEYDVAGGYEHPDRLTALIAWAESEDCRE